ncbi:hypothetical protein [Actinomyces israelii]|uniref:hypothetical protein n=1 Tax=Actinomyces israelii TaxID=1659 RepID=UPI002556E8C6|nr:hypothetical protein [Actinomyces israelii]WKR20359.1 hypothetical protein AIF0345_0234 [Actinomyces israelii]
MNRDDIIERLRYTYALPRGPQRSALVAEAVTWADEIGDEQLQVNARTRLVADYAWGGEEWKGLAPFVWCLARQAERPDLFDERMSHHLRWHYKWAVTAAARNPAVPLEQVRALEAGMEAFYREQGASMHTVHGQRFYVARRLGRYDEARAELAAWRAAPRDESSDCEACDPERQVTQAIDDGDDELAIATAVPVLAEEIGCDEQPASIRTVVLLPLLRTGRTRAAWDAHVRAYRVYRHDPRHAGALEDHFYYLALSGHVDRGLRILRRHASWTALCDSASDLEGFICGAAVLLHQAVREGRGAERLGVDLPENPTWCPGAAVGADSTLAQAAEQCEAWARRIDAAYDERNGNDSHTQSLEETLAWRPYVERVQDGMRVELLETPEALPEAASISDLDDGAPAGEAGRRDTESSAPAGAAGPAASAGAEAPAGSGASAAGVAGGAPSSSSSAPGAAPAHAPSSPLIGAGTGGYPPVRMPVLIPPTSIAEALTRLHGPGAYPGRAEWTMLHDWLWEHGALDAEAPAGLEAEAAAARAVLYDGIEEFDRAFEERRAARDLLAARPVPAGGKTRRRARLLRLDLQLLCDAAGADSAAGREASDDDRCARLGDLIAQVSELADQLPVDLSGAEPPGTAEPGTGTAEPGTGTAEPAQPGRGARAAAYDLRELFNVLYWEARACAQLLGIADALPVIETLRAVADRLGDAGLDPDGTLRDRVDSFAAFLHGHDGDIYEAARAADSLLRRRDPASLVTVVESRVMLGRLSREYDQEDEAVVQYREAANLLLAAGLQSWAVEVLGSLSNALGASGRFLEAAEVLETGIELAETARRPDRARGLREILVKVLTDLEEHAGVLEAAGALAQAELERGQAAKAREYLESAADAAQRLKRPEEACALLRRCAELCPIGQEPDANDGTRLAYSRFLRRAARALVTQPSIQASRAHEDEALDLIREARRVQEAIPAQGDYSDVWEAGSLERELADVLWRCDDNMEAAEAARRAIAGFMTVGDRVSAAREYAFICNLYAERREEPGAREAARAALEEGRALLADLRWDHPDEVRYLDEAEAFLNREE